jgi:hypothetical protein
MSHDFLLAFLFSSETNDFKIKSNFPQTWQIKTQTWHICQMDRCKHTKFVVRLLKFCNGCVGLSTSDENSLHRT